MPTQVLSWLWYPTSPNCLHPFHKNQMCFRKCPKLRQSPPNDCKSSELVKVKVSLAFIVKVHPSDTNGLFLSAEIIEECPGKRRQSSIFHHPLRLYIICKYPRRCLFTYASIAYIHFIYIFFPPYACSLFPCFLLRKKCSSS